MLCSGWVAVLGMDVARLLYLAWMWPDCCALDGCGQIGVLCGNVT